MLSWENYENRIFHVAMQFNIAKEVISSFKDTPEAVERYLKNELDYVRSLTLKAIEKSKKDPKEYWAFRNKDVEKFLASCKTHIPKYLEQVENRLNQNKLILLVSIYEIFMKDIHREILWQNPKLMKSDKQISFQRALSLGFDKVIEEEIEKEVQSLDRKKLDDRAKYFKEVLGIDWFEGKIVPLLKRVINIRNSILHQDPNKNVDDDDVTLTFLVCFAIPWISLIQAAVLYPKGFKMIKGVSPSEARKLTNIKGLSKDTKEQEKNNSK